VTKRDVRPGCQFASDNAAGICPAAWESLAEANIGYAPGYGDDAWTQRAADKIREVFESDAEVYFTFNGTAANSLSLAALCQSYHSVICSDVAHIEVDECGGPEFFSNGSKLLLAHSKDGKITPESIAEIAKKRTDIHYPKPSVVSITQPTEVGTTYTIKELSAIGAVAKEWGLAVHMDGARFANAVAEMNVSPRQLTVDVGIDVLCLGGTKNGMPVGDAVVFFNKKLAFEFDYRCKQAGQLASKMRFLTAPWVGMLQDGAWIRYAAHANRMAKRLEEKLRQVKGVEILFQRQANAVFARLPVPWNDRLRKQGWRYYDFIGKGGARFMCSWATVEADVDALIAEIESCESVVPGI
jgi:threonine aldolase